ncbi:hypothetical protein [Virgisporangium aurantiacum]|uniref:Uncharacterized protein n=1 Tax=Virgisporangium aurantiacum TaxID=175570 RepID=A0A8J4E6I9_9ACTN|nr:hypothetical protein [Virgisporangium aurantiacum]GIJ64135.1 hypothetical protein Vau01_116510 [Virgisporangium aurantiacum]
MDRAATDVPSGQAAAPASGPAAAPDPVRDDGAPAAGDAGEMARDTREAGAPGAPAQVPRPVRIALAGAVLAAGAAAALWITVVALTAGHGLDVSDEGYYLLSYRWWRVNMQTFTGAQYLYGPVFELVGYDITGLRLVRLLSVVGTHLAFGWAFMRWLRVRRPRAPATWLWEAAGVAVILACGGMVYSWLPLSPGYNDVSLLGALLAVAIVLRMATHADRTGRVPAWVPALFGPVVVAMLLAKWSSSAVTLAVVALAGLAAVAPLGWRQVLRVTAWALAGTVATVLLIQLLVVPLTTAVPEMLATNRLVAAGANSPAALLKLYARTTWDLVKVMVDGHFLVFLAAIVAVVLRGRAAIGAGVVAAVALSVSAWRVIVDGNYHGGTANLLRYPVGLSVTFAVVLLVAIAVLVDRRARGSALRVEGWRGWTILAAVALVPVTQAAGTGNPLYFMAINGFAAWAAIMLAILTGLETAPVIARVLTATVTAAAVLLSAVVAGDGLWAHPYRAAPRTMATAEVPGAPALSGIRLTPKQAADYAGLRRRLAPYLDPPGRAIMAYDEMAGIVLLLDGRPVGEAWYSAIAPDRTAAGVRKECSDGRGWWGTRSPVVILHRPITQVEIDALRSCGLDFATDYRLLAPPGETLGLQVYVPTDDVNGQ